MFERTRKALGFEQNSQFVTKVLALSFPTALVFTILSAAKIIEPLLAIISTVSVVVFNIIWLFPLTVQLQQIKKYIASITGGAKIEELSLNLSETEAKELTEAVNAMHRFWAQRAEDLEAQTISDTAVLDTLPDPIIMIDRGGNILGANLSARNNFGKNITDMCIDKIFNSNNFIRAVNKVLCQESNAENIVFYVRKPKDKKLYAHIKALPWISKGKAVAVIAIYDLTKSLKIEKMQSDFVANASHELRTPLSVISGFIETLQTSAKDDPDAQEKFLKIMGEQAQYMSDLIENLLSLSRIELNQDQPPETFANIKNIINDVVKALTVKAADRNMKINIFCEENIPYIIADYAQIKQVLHNLTDNATKYGLSGTDITISIKNVDKIPMSKHIKNSDVKAIAISINNKGPKIESDKLARLTERFYRLQEHKDLSIKGTGLGLAIAKHIIIRHQGNLTVNSNNYKGTTFTIYLPIDIAGK